MKNYYNYAHWLTRPNLQGEIDTELEGGDRAWSKPGWY